MIILGVVGDTSALFYMMAWRSPHIQNCWFLGAVLFRTLYHLRICLFSIQSKNFAGVDDLRMFTPVNLLSHYNDVIMGTIASQITSLTSVYSSVYSGADQSKHQSSASLAFVREIHRRPENSPHKWPVTRKMFPFDDVIMKMLKSVGELYCMIAQIYKQATGLDA